MYNLQSTPECSKLPNVIGINLNDERFGVN